MVITLAMDEMNGYTMGSFYILMDDQMTTLTITKQNAQDMVQLILRRIQHGNVIVEMYDDTDVGTLSYDSLTPEQQKRYDEVDLIDTSLYTDA